MMYGQDVLQAIMAGAVVGGGLLLLVLSLRGFPRRPGKPGSKRDPAELLRSLGTRVAIAVGVGAVVLITTRWVVVAVGAGLLVLGWHGIAGGAAEERRAMVRLEALAAWSESLRDTIAGAVGLEQAIPSSLRACAPILQLPLRMLVDRMHTRVPLPEAFRRFADDLDDPSADLVVGALILNARLRGPGLKEMLTALSVSARAERPGGRGLLRRHGAVPRRLQPCLRAALRRVPRSAGPDLRLWPLRCGLPLAAAAGQV